MTSNVEYYEKEYFSKEKEFNDFQDYLCGISKEMRKITEGLQPTSTRGIADFNFCLSYLSKVIVPSVKNSGYLEESLEIQKAVDILTPYYTQALMSAFDNHKDSISKTKEKN